MIAHPATGSDNSIIRFLPGNPGTLRTLVNLFVVLSLLFVDRLYISILVVFVVRTTILITISNN